jgi:TIR domain
MTKPIQIFFSYAHEDEALMDAVRRQLIVFDRQRVIEKWHDRKIPPGTKWKNKIDQRLRNADIILLFVSPHFFESDYCFETEMREALRRHASGAARVIPIILRPCLWQSAPFAQLQALPRDAKAISTWPNIDEACVDAAQGVMNVVFQLAGEVPSRAADSTSSSAAQRPRDSGVQSKRSKTSVRRRPKT